jgi:hypothetical protein
MIRKNLCNLHLSECLNNKIIKRFVGYHEECASKGKENMKVVKKISNEHHW